MPSEKSASLILGQLGWLVSRDQALRRVAGNWGGENGDTRLSSGLRNSDARFDDRVDYTPWLQDPIN